MVLYLKHKCSIVGNTKLSAVSMAFSNCYEAVNY